MSCGSAEYLYIFLDEGGNFDFSPTGTKYFTLTSISKPRPFQIAPALDSLKYDLIETGLNITVVSGSDQANAL